MHYIETIDQLKRIFERGEVLDIELMAKRPFVKDGSEDGWAKVRPASECFTVLLLAHVRANSDAHEAEGAPR